MPTLHRFVLGASFVTGVTTTLPAQPAPATPGPTLGVTGAIRFHGRVPSRHVAARNVEVWLPPDYARDRATRYPVLYLHDGQNVFNPATSYIGVDWAVDEVMTRLIAERRVRPAIVVAVWNTPARFYEYMPRRALDFLPDSIKAIPQARAQTDSVRSDQYLRFLVEELKPMIDRAYRTRPERASTFVMGSSMGGLISLYALTQHPTVFGGAACVSTHWPIGDGATLAWAREALVTRRAPSPATHRLWFDHGTATLDSLYAPHQQRVDSLMRAAGFTHGRNWVTKVYPGADHSERAWRARVEEPIVFLLGR